MGGAEIRTAYQFFNQEARIKNICLFDFCIKALLMSRFEVISQTALVVGIYSFCQCGVLSLGEWLPTFRMNLVPSSFKRPSGIP
jgi:hypothetical protein